MTGTIGEVGMHSARNALKVPQRQVAFHDKIVEVSSLSA